MEHFKQTLRCIVCLLGLVSIFSCSKEEFINNNVETLPDTCDSIPVINISDQGLFDTIYSGFKYYQGFYTENLNGGSIYFENTVSVNQASDAIILCSDDSITALNWSEQSANNSSYYRPLVSSRANEKYFEFRRVSTVNPNSILLSRVLKCSYLDLTLLEKSNSNNRIIGTFNQRPITLTNSLEVIEFLSFLWSHKLMGKKMLSSETCETNDSIQIVLFETDVVYGDWGVYDRISLSQSTYTINKSDGLIKKRKQLIRTITGKIN
jgi:hypothetical protein